jgi:hypothetical protein
MPKYRPPTPADKYDVAAWLASLFPDEKSFLRFARLCWRMAHEELRPRGRRPILRDRCFDAIWESLERIGAVQPLTATADFTDVKTVGKWTIVTRSHKQVPLGRLIQFIRDRMPGLSRNTAKKYAREWERANEVDAQATPIKDRMTLYKRVKRDPVLYTRHSKK